MSTSSSGGPGVHQTAEGPEHIRQQKAGSTSDSRGPGVLYIREQRAAGVHQAAEGREYIRKQRVWSSSGR